MTASKQATRSRKSGDATNSGRLDANSNREAQPEVQKTSDDINRDSKSRIKDDNHPREPTSHDGSQERATDNVVQSETINQSSVIFELPDEYDFSQEAETHATDEARPAENPLFGRGRADRASRYAQVNTTAATIGLDLYDEDFYSRYRSRRSGSETSVDTTATVVNLNLHSAEGRRPLRSRSRRYRYKSSTTSGKKSSKYDHGPTALDDPPPPMYGVPSDVIANIKTERENNAKTEEQEQPDVKLPDTALRSFRIRTDATDVYTLGR